MKKNKWDGCPPLLYQNIETKEDIANCRNFMSESYYPITMTDCEVCGINGDCGDECPAKGSKECNFEDMGGE